MKSKELEIFANLKSEEQYVAFVDILGYKAKIESCNDLRKIALLNFLMEQYKNEGEEDLRVFTFSDCMYIVGDKLDIMMKYLACLQIQMLGASPKRLDNGEIYEDVNLLRGGIAKGTVIANKELNIILGPAAIKAYELECNKAVMPRIILDDSLNESEGPYVDNDDGISYFNFLKYLNVTEHYQIPKDNKDLIINYLNNYITKSKNDDVNKKYKWFINYLNEN